MTPRPLLGTRDSSLRHACLWAIVLVALLPGWVAAGEKKETVEYETGFYYTVKKGDTLWSLSKKFSDNAWEWPEMWKNNDQIPNPHLIYPGERIRIYQKARTEEMAVPEKPVKTAPKPEVKEPPYFYYSLIDRVGFIEKTPLEASGSIFKVRDNKEMISIGDIVYIRPAGPGLLKIGERYTVYRTLKPYKDPQTRQLIGVQHYLTGGVEIETIEADYATARVFKAYRTIEISDLLTPYHQRSPKIPLAKAPPGITGTILVAEEQEQLIGTNFVAFIDKGFDDGIRPGQQFRVFDEESIDIVEGKEKKTTVTQVDFATFIVLFTEPGTSTVLITRSTKNIAPGAKFHSVSM